MSKKKPRSVERGNLAEPVLVAVTAGPDEVVVAAVLGFDQAGVDRCGEARIVQLDREVFALRLAGGLLPGRAEFGGAGEDAEVGAALALALAGDELGLDVEGQGLDRAGEARAVLVLGEGADGRHCRIPFPVGPLHCDLDGGRETGDDRPRTRQG